MGSSADTGVFEPDESYFGAKRVRGKRGRGAAGKTPVFGLLNYINLFLVVTMNHNFAFRFCDRF